MAIPTSSLITAVYLDLDGVVADFFGYSRALLGQDYRAMRGEQAWGVLDKHPALFRKLPLLPDALQLWQGLQEFVQRRQAQALVLTALPRLTGQLITAPGDKRWWVRGHLDAAVPVILAPNGIAKARWASPGSLLIDDTARNISAWEAAGGLGILHVSAVDTLRQLEQL